MCWLGARAINCLTIAAPMPCRAETLREASRVSGTSLKPRLGGFGGEPGSFPMCQAGPASQAGAMNTSSLHATVVDRVPDGSRPVRHQAPPPTPGPPGSHRPGRDIMHPMFKELFIETDADDQSAEE